MGKQKHIHVRINRVKDEVRIIAGVFNKGKWVPRDEVTTECFEAVRDMLLATKQKDSKMNGVEWKVPSIGKIYKLFIAEYELPKEGEADEDSQSSI